MRIHSEKLFADYGDKIGVQGWDNTTQFLNQITGAGEYSYASDHKYLILESKQLYSTKNFITKSDEGSINTSVNPTDFSFNKTRSLGLALLYNSYITTEGGSLSLSYSIWDNANKWSAVRNFPTTKDTIWQTCKWIKSIPVHGGFLIVGRRLYKSKLYGVYTCYNITGGLTTPKGFNTTYFKNAIQIYKSGTFLNIIIGGNGYIMTSTSSYDATGTTTGNLPTTTWNIQQVGENIDWNNIAYGNNIIVITSRDGWMSYSKDDGATWISPMKIAKLDSIDTIAYTYKKFFIIGGITGKGAYSVSTSYFTRFSEPEAIFASDGSCEKVLYDNSKQIALFSDGYISEKVWTPINN